MNLLTMMGNCNSIWFSKGKPYIWGFFLPAVVWALLGGCGLPDYVSIQAPAVLDDAYTSESTVLGFSAPADDSYINGYALYYKIYSPADISSEKNADIDEFGKNNLPTGSSIPNKRGFFIIGKAGESDIETITVSHTAAGDDYYIDFDPENAGTSNSDNWGNPVVGTSNPVNSGTILATLARGFKDPAASDPTLRSFVADWNFDDADGPANDLTTVYLDGDLRRGYNKQSLQPGFQVQDIVNVGDSIFSSDKSRLFIGIAVHSVGWDPSTYRRLDSTPVFLGTIEYSPLNDVDR